MRPNEVIRTVVGSIVVYVIVAACSGASNAPSSHSETAGATSESSVQGGAPAIESTAPATGYLSGAAHSTDGPTPLRGGAAGATGAIAQAGLAMNDGGVEGASGVAATGGTRASATTAAIASAGATGVLDPVPTAKADPVSGTRLKAKFREGADGSKEFIYGVWWDSQRSEDCSFTATADGTSRCLPAAIGSVGSSSYFSNSSCGNALNVAMHIRSCTRPTPKYISELDADCASLTKRFYAVGAQYTGSLFAKSGTTCVDVSSSVATYEFYALGAEIPLTSFVASTLKTAD